MNKETIEIGFPMEFENEDGTIDNVLLLRPNEIKAVEYRLQELERYKNIIDKTINFIESMEYCGQEDYFYDEQALDPCGNDNTFEESKTKLLDILKGE